VSNEEFVRRKNIERYRQMLESGSVIADEREMIMRLLAEEEDCDLGTGSRPDSSAAKKTIVSGKS
jgi:hypothetical protein